MTCRQSKERLCSAALYMLLSKIAEVEVQFLFTFERYLCCLAGGSKAKFIGSLVKLSTFQRYRRYVFTATYVYCRC